MLFYFLNLSVFFALHVRVHFFCTDKRNGTKEKPPRCVGLRRLCALQSEPGTVNSLSLRHAPRYSGSDFQCSTTQKGMEDQNRICRSAVSARFFIKTIAPRRRSYNVAFDSVFDVDPERGEKSKTRNQPLYKTVKISSRNEYISQYNFSGQIGG